MTAYATVAELRAGLTGEYAASPEIADDGDAQLLIDRASEVIDEVTMLRAGVAYDSETDLDVTPYRDALRDATIRQVEFWLEVGPEHDVSGLHGSLVAGRVQVHPVPGVLGQRAKRTLINAGLYWSGAAVG